MQILPVPGSACKEQDGWQSRFLSKCETILSHDEIHLKTPGERLEAGENRNDPGDLLHGRHPIEAVYHIAGRWRRGASWN
jgi:hypothetical protein